MKLFWLFWQVMEAIVRISQTLTLKIWGWTTVSIANFKGKVMIKN